MVESIWMIEGNRKVNENKFISHGGYKIRPYYFDATNNLDGKDIKSLYLLRKIIDNYLIKYEEESSKFWANFRIKQKSE